MRLKAELQRATVNAARRWKGPAAELQKTTVDAASCRRWSCKTQQTMLHATTGRAASGRQRSCNAQQAMLQASAGVAARRRRRSYKAQRPMLHATSVLLHRRRFDGDLLRRWPWLIEEQRRERKMLLIAFFLSGGESDLCTRATHEQIHGRDHLIGRLGSRRMPGCDPPEDA